MVDVRFLYHSPTAQILNKNILTPVNFSAGGSIGKGTNGCLYV